MHWIPELMIQLCIHGYSCTDDGAGQQAICGIYHSKITCVVYIDTLRTAVRMYVMGYVTDYYRTVRPRARPRGDVLTKHERRADGDGIGNSRLQLYGFLILLYSLRPSAVVQL